MERGEVWWANLPEPRGSEPGYRRPVVVVQSDWLNRSALSTVLVVSVTGNLNAAAKPGNVVLPADESGLSRDSVANVSQLAAIDRAFFTEVVGRVTDRTLAQIDDGLRLVLAL